MQVSPDAPVLDVVLVGPGRLGKTMAAALSARGHRARLVGRGEAVPPAPLTWLCVPDRAIDEAARAVPAGGVLLHASGATDLTPLRPYAPAGSLHPLMTFPGEGLPPRLEGVPAAVAGDPEAVAAATALARALGLAPFTVPGDRRLYHAAAVMAGNFATALLAEAAAVLSAAGVPPDQAPAILAPLARQSIENAAARGPAATLTGPVARGDEAVILGHQEALAALPPRLGRSYAALLEAARALVTAPRDIQGENPGGDPLLEIDSGSSARKAR